MNTKKFWLITVIFIVALAVVILALRFFSGDEDTWLCSGGQWVKHGHPSAPQPTTGCGEEIKNFDDCVAAGNPIMEIYPEQCRSKDGRIFVREINGGDSAGIANPASVYCADNGGKLENRKDKDGGEYGVCLFQDGSECDEWQFYRGECMPKDKSLVIKKNCEDLCGDDVCQEVVCLAVGCPCAETRATCPGDCK